MFELAPAPVAAADADEAFVEEIISTGTFRSDDITNIQEAGVDEGGIVKAAGDYLVILRRGRLFTVSTGSDRLRAVDAVDAFPPGVEGDYYDEMLIAGDRVLVLGFSYESRGTEINRFRLLPDGRLKFEDSYHVKSDDYYSSENYATRLIGETLVLYTPLSIRFEKDPLEALPSMRRWKGQEDDEGFRRIAARGDIYLPPSLRRDKDADVSTLHTVTTCDVAAVEMDCRSTAVFGPESRNFYVSAHAVYLWVSDGRSEDSATVNAMVYRLPLDGGRPTAAAVRGAPANQFSFREDAEEGVLNVLVRSRGGGDAMWRPQFTQGSLALLRLPLSQFGDGSGASPASLYRPLPRPSDEDDYGLENRFAGRHLIYAAGRGWGDVEDEASKLFVTPLRGGAVTELSVPSAVGRIELIGRDALAVGAGERDLTFSTVELVDGATPRLGDRYVHRAASEAETRSHAFFFRPTSADGASGLIGLPVARPARPGWKQLWEDSSAMVFLRRADRRLSPLGELAASQEPDEDGCKASCDDWYGNARPIFLRDRTFALMGYELVEGRVTAGGIVERRRISFLPKHTP
jgi:hypothetical protein